MVQTKTPAAVIQVEHEVDDMTLGTLRFRFKQLREAALYCVSLAVWMGEVRRLAGEKPSPQDWVTAAERATTKCDACVNGVYSWGAQVNGRMTHSGPCFRCQGKGRQGQADYTRNRHYDSHRRI